MVAIQPANSTTRNVANATSGQSMLWGYPVETWDWWALRLMLAGAVFGVLALAVSLASSFILYKTAGVSQADSDRRIVEAVATGKKADAEAAKANEAIAREQVRAALLEKETVQARLELERLKAKVAWRRLSKAQRDGIIASLSGQSFEIWVGTLRQDPEAMGLWEDIVETLKAAGLKVTAHTAWERAVGVSISPIAVPEREAIKNAFANVGIELHDSSGDSSRLKKLEIIVGSKPPPF